MGARIQLHRGEGRRPRSAPSSAAATGPAGRAFAPQRRSAPPAGPGAADVRRGVNYLDRTAVHPERLRPRGRGRPLPEALRQQLEPALGQPLDEVRVHEDGGAEQIDALAFTRGTDLHFAPGRYRPHEPAGRRLIAHELAHVAQQRAGRVKTPGGGGAPVNADPRLEDEAERFAERAARGLAPSPAAGGGGAGAPGPGARGTARNAPGSAAIQPGFLDFFRKKKDPERQPLHDPAAPLPEWIHGGGRRGVGVDVGPQVDEGTHGAISTPIPSDVSQGLAIATGLGSTASLGTRIADVASAKGIPGDLVPGIGVAAGPIAAGGSLIDAGLKAHQIATGRQKLKDKTLEGIEGVADLGRATVSGASTAIHGSTLLGTAHTAASVAGTAGSVAGVAGIAGGAADLIGGGVSGLLAHKRQGRLGQIAERHDDTSEGAVARFAQEAQKSRRTRGAGTALKGALSIAGGATLLAAGASNPIGWGLLGGAAVVGAGLKAYKLWRKHSQAKKLLNDPHELERLKQAGVRIPGERELAAQSWKKKIFATKKSRTHDLIRGQLAQRLAEQMDVPGRAEGQEDDWRNSPLTAIVGQLGVSNKGRKKGRAKDIARALEG